jgi:formate/nitrite transporter
MAGLRYAVVFSSIASMHALLHGVGPATLKPVISPARAAVRVLPAMQAGLVATPQEGFDGAVAAGTKKANMPAGKIFGLGVLSGCHIGFGAFLMLSVGGACGGLVAAGNPGLKMIISGAFGLPVGLFMTLMTGAELFTGNTALVTMATLEGKADAGQLAKSWVTSWVGNLVGSVGFAYLVFLGGTLASGGVSVPVAMAKTSLSFKQAFVRGILCNWLVCMAVYIASFAKDLTGKMTAIWFIISTFIALGLEHSVANMFIIPLGIFSGAAVTWKSFFLANLLPVTLGNIVGGAVCVAAAMNLAYGTWMK